MSHWEGTLYRGLHYMDVDIFAKGRPVIGRAVGVYVV